MPTLEMATLAWAVALLVVVSETELGLALRMLPPEVVETLAGAVHKAIETPEVRQRFTSSGTDIFWSGPEEFDAFVKSELVKWTAAIKEAGIEPE